MYVGVKDWRDLDSRLNGAFSARAGDFLGSKFTLSAEGPGDFGVMKLEDSSRNASFESGDLTSTIENGGLTRRMWTAGEETLSAKSGYSGVSIQLGGTECEASVSPFRNTASCYAPRDPENERRELVRVAGGLMSRNYTASFEAGYLEVAVFLLYYTATLRKRAFRAESAAVRR